MQTARRQATFYLGAVALVAATAAVLIWLIVSITRSPGKITTTPGARPHNLVPAQRLFAPTSVWNAEIPANAKIDSSSDRMVAGLDSEVSSELSAHTGPDIGTAGTTTFYRVAADQQTVRVQLSNPTLSWRASLQAAFDRVPIPSTAKPAAGSDAEMTVWQPSTDKLWEFFHMSKASDGWHADWGGAIRNVSQSPGYYTTSSWPGALPVWGATATSLPEVAGVITRRDLESGRIDHALAIALPAPRAGIWSWPAQRTDGTGTDPSAIPEGARLRLDPKVNLAALHLPRLTSMIAEAAQKYGLIVLDQTHDAIGLYAESPLSLGANPYYTRGTPNPSGPFQGRWPSELMARFPWSRLQVLALHPCVRVGAACTR